MVKKYIFQKIYTFQDFSHTNALGIKVDLAIKEVKVNLRSSFVLH